MKRRNTSGDEQLAGIQLETVLEKRRNGQAMSAKEFAVLTNYCYSTVRQWFFKTKGFPTIGGKVFFEDFLQWKAAQFNSGAEEIASNSHHPVSHQDSSKLPQRAAEILRQAGEVAQNRYEKRR